MLNPQVAEIQSRVEDLVRRYDDALAAMEMEENRDDEDDSFGDNRVQTPSRWRVGDVLLSTHRSLARTSTHTERTIVSEFADDPEVNSAMGPGAQKMGNDLTEVAEQAARRHQRLSHIHQALYVASRGESIGNIDDEDEEYHHLPSSARELERQLRGTIEALHRENASMMAQLQDAQRSNREACLAAEQQAQELSRAQRALRAQSEELRLAQETNDKSAEASNALLASWRDKFQASSKAAAAAEAAVQELEAKVRAQSEEIMKQTFVMQTKAQEMERFKEHEAARQRTSAAAQAAALADAEAEAKRTKAKAVEDKRRSKASVEDSSRGLREMEEKVRTLESALHYAENATKDLEKENAELSQRMRDMQVRFGELRKYTLSARAEDMKAAAESTFSLRLREQTPPGKIRKRKKDEIVPKGAVAKPIERSTPKTVSAEIKHELLNEIDEIDNDDNVRVENEFSSDSEMEEDEPDEQFDEVERDELEMNTALKHVVATMFPPLAPEQNGSSLDDNIAQYEDSTRSPLRDIFPGPVDPGTVVSTGNMVPRSELNALRVLYDNEIEELRQQYVEGLLEYKRLVIEQYGRRQAVERERHRLEIEGLLRLIQTKFHAEFGRRNDRLKRSKQALKALYNALRKYSVPTIKPPRHDKDQHAPANSPAPLRTLLNAAILAMSSSAKRNQKGTLQIAAICDQLMANRPVMAIHTVIRESKPASDTTTEEAECQTDVITKSSEGGSNIEHIALEALRLMTGAPISPLLIAEMRRSLPRLPPGNYYVSSGLRHALFQELMRYYATVGLNPDSPARPSGEDQLREVEVVIGSPRDTPFLRRKAVEALESKTRQRNRRHLFTSGGVAILQTAFTSASSGH
ncbi:hypothetical protein PHYBOEH_000519 [Phytophthora boehmeriae]|uniref:Uncharacterized protein n=1 Tax=Phytophthora boehmeriae TaxID=109152 RepID=A0A8T1WVW2_9STRA|nr:hypothetical protein PHYBOEH_000519 [Phytophthora boehmeriae]